MLKADKYKRLINEDPKKKTIDDKDKIVTAKGNVITKAEFEKAKKNGLEFESHEKYAEYVDGWAKPIKEESSTDKPTTPIQPSTFRSTNETGGSKSGYQSSPESIKAIEAKERRLRAASSYGNGGGRRQ